MLPHKTVRGQLALGRLAVSINYLYLVYFCETFAFCVTLYSVQHE